MKTTTSKKEKKTKNLELERLDNLDMQGKALKIKLYWTTGKYLDVPFASYVMKTNFMMHFTKLWLGKYTG